MLFVNGTVRELKRLVKRHIEVETLAMWLLYKRKKYTDVQMGRKFNHSGDRIEEL